ncbi:amidophosphoribosyltransferase [Candidatus Marinamargulisbacteria bacterium SCGC AAA071-K20]|nr:amidophosphoribosyltransferase [Candidatus Marinamargulisbacteria bacterium SCGC AAA071-K20]
MGLKEECGVFGVFGCKDAANLCYLGLYALQHRGQESAGIVSLEGKNFYVVKDSGLVSEVFNPKNIAYLKGTEAIGHVRYSTTGSNDKNNIQPLYSKTSHGKYAVAHNGNLTNAFTIYKTLEQEGALFHSTVDSEIILHLLSRAKGATHVERLQSSLKQVEGAYSICILGEKFLIAARDPFGFRPLVLGKKGDGYIVASETCALDLIEATYVREVEPGEIIFIDKDGLQSYKIPVKVTPKFCVFEHIYFARPDSVVYSESVHEVRKAFGRKLAQEHPVDADLVMAIPDSGNSAALGYAEESGIPYEVGMTRNHYVGRTFIQPQQKIRDFFVKVKLNPIRSVLKGKRVIVIDDSIVRGTTSKKRVSAILAAGAKEVHLRISSPPIRNPCHFGIDTPKREKLIASKKTVNEILEYVGGDSLGYLSIKGMLEVIKAYPASSFCTACFDGKYPLKVKDKGKYTFEGRKIKLYAEKTN